MLQNKTAVITKNALIAGNLCCIDNVAELHQFWLNPVPGC